MDFTPNGQDLITATFTGFLAVIGWLIISQINTNKALMQQINDVILDVRMAISLWDERDKNQHQTCGAHRTQTAEIRKHVDTEISKLRREIETIKNKKP